MYVCIYVCITVAITGTLTGNSLAVRSSVIHSALYIDGKIVICDWTCKKRAYLHTKFGLVQFTSKYKCYYNKIFMSYLQINKKVMKAYRT